MFRRIGDQRNLVWLDSGGPVGPRSRYSYLCYDPFSVLEKRGGELRQDGVLLNGDPFTALARLMARWAEPPGRGPVPFMGGAVGLLGYGLARHLERLPHRHADEPDLPELWFGLFDLVLAFDRQEQRCWLISSGLPETCPQLRSSRAASRADHLQALLQRRPVDPAPLPALTWRPDRSAASYRRMVGRGLELIRAGDVFQVNLTMRHVAPRPEQLDPALVHLQLRRSNPAPFAAYIGWEGGRALSSASPERFLRLQPDGQMETRPIKGTRARVPDPMQDATEAASLLGSAKDRAENLMIVDLMRNDISRVAVPGSVRVPELCAVESFATVHHLVSTVIGRLAPGTHAVGLLRATFPGGSVTGAPKIRAMQIIDDLERSARGPYCGCIAWLGFDGGMDSSIVIRTLLLTGAHVVAQAGGGVVADSVPAAEHEEMLVKVAPLLRIFPATDAER